VRLLGREELLAELERFHERVQQREGPDFISELVKFREFLNSDPRLRRILDRLAEEAIQFETNLQAADRDLAPRAIALKGELLELAPDAADDRELPRPPHPQRDHHWIYSFTNFDLVAAGDPDGVSERQGMDTTKTGFFLRVLESHLHSLQWLIGDGPVQSVAEENQRPELADLQRRVARLGYDHRQNLQTFERAAGSHGGFALLELDMVLQKAEAPSPSDGTDEDEARYMNEVFGWVSGQFHLILEAQRPTSQRTLDSRDLDGIKWLGERLRPLEDRLYEAVRAVVLRSPSDDRRGFWRSLWAWLSSPIGGFLSIAPAGQAVIQLVTQEGKATVWLIVVAAGFAVLPPLAWSLLAPLLQRWQARRDERPHWTFSGLRRLLQPTEGQGQRVVAWAALPAGMAVLAVTLVAGLDAGLGVFGLGAAVLVLLRELGTKRTEN
jgi:hypothetical protein